MNTSKIVLIEPKSEISFDWKKISKEYKKDPAGLDSFIKESKNKIAIMLIEATKKRRLVPELLRKVSSQSSLNQIVFNEDEIWGEVRLVICHLLQRWETICRQAVLSNKKTKHATLKGELRMNTENDLIGYFRNALQNAFADLFIKHNAQKRSAAEVTFSSMFPDNDDDNEKNFEETIACNRSNELIYKSYKKDMINFLRSYDRENNTKTARLFVALINPRHNGAITTIQSNLKINNKVFNETKELIIRLLHEEFSDVAVEMLSHMEKRKGDFEELEIANKISRQYKNRKKQKAKEKKTPRPCRMNVIYGQRLIKDKNKWEFYATVTVDRSKTHKIVAFMPDNWETIFKEEETIVGKSDQMPKIRSKLEKAIKKHVADAQKLLDQAPVFKEEESAA